MIGCCRAALGTDVGLIRSKQGLDLVCPWIQLFSSPPSYNTGFYQLDCAYTWAILYPCLASVSVFYKIFTAGNRKEQTHNQRAMVLVYLKNLLTGSPPKSRHYDTPPLLPTIQDFATDFTTTTSSSPRKDYGTTGGCDPQSSACRHPSCPRRQVSRNTSTLKPDDQEGGQLSRPLFDPRVLSDLTIGLSDGLTVPFALTAGLSAFNDTKVVLYGGIAELIAGSISMGLGGWLAGRGEA